MSIRELPGLSTHYVGRALYYFEELDSTNNYAKDHAAELPHGAVVLAARQTAGKGRRGRSWSGGTEQCLMMTILFKGMPAQALPVLPLLAGLAVSRALEGVCSIPFPIKWSNDVLCMDGKICGILCEGRTTGQDGYAVVGIGVNLLQTAEDFSRHGLVYAQSLFLATGRKYDFAQIAAAVCSELEPIMDIFYQNGFGGALREEYKTRCRTLGQGVSLSDGRKGIALDIGEDGALVCNIGGKVCSVSAGEVSVRGLYGYV